MAYSGTRTFNLSIEEIIEILKKEGNAIESEKMQTMMNIIHRRTLKSINRKYITLSKKMELQNYLIYDIIKK